MEIKDVIEEKKKLTESIGTLILEFEERTGTKISSIYVRNWGEGWSVKEKVNVNLDV